MIRTVIVEDQEMVRRGLVSLLSMEPDIEVVGEAADGESGVATVLRLEPDVALIDIRMPLVDGIEAMRRITGAGARTRLLALTTFDLDEYIFESLKAGASGFLLKDATVDELAAAIRIAASGDAILAPPVTRRVIDAFVRVPERRDESAILGKLTAREADVLRLVARGYSNAEIAQELVLTQATVKSHVSNVLAKLELRDRIHAVILAHEHGLATR